MGGISFFPDQASSHAVQVDLLFGFTLALTLFFTVLVAAGLLYFAVRYRRRSADEVPPQTTGNTRLEVGGMVVLLGLAMFTFGWATILYLESQQPPADATEIFVVGKKWMWKYEYPDGQSTINDLYVPLGQPIKLTLTSQDVIHSYFVPAFRIKQDALPGRYTSLWFEATEAGTYHLFCTEYCGTSHSRMIGSVIVMEPAAYEEWLAGGPKGDPVEAGMALFNNSGCAGCHLPAGNGPGPSLVGVFGNERPLEGGQRVVADATYLRTAIVDPNEQVVEGYRPIMPTYEGQLAEEEIIQLIAYLQSLGGGAPVPSAPAPTLEEGDASATPSRSDDATPTPTTGVTPTP